MTRINEERLTTIMDREGLDGLISTSAANFTYLTGFASDGLSQFPYEHQAYAIITRDAPTSALIIESQGLSNQSLDGYDTIKGIITYGSFFRPGPFLDVELTPWEIRLQNIGKQKPEANAPAALLVGIQQMDLVGKRIGIDEVNLKPEVLFYLKKKLPDTEFVMAGHVFRWVRKVKTETEIKLLVDANRVVENAIHAAMAVVREGITEFDMVREFNHSVVSQGAMPQFTLIHFGRNAVAGETTPRFTPLKCGEPIWFDCGCLLNCYYSDIARIGFLGEPNTRAIEVYNALLFGEEEAKRLTKPGMSGDDIFNLTMQATRDAGLVHYERHHVGHGIGLELYEDVRIAPGVTDIVEEGTIVNIETPYYELGLGALHIEDPFVVQGDGNYFLTSMTRNPIIIHG